MCVCVFRTLLTYTYTHTHLHSHTHAYTHTHTHRQRHRHRDLMRVASNRNAKRPCESKVGEFELSFVVNKQVLRLDVTVKDAVVVTEGDCL